ncbi:unnamed protein product [Coffea canephora]|uniref:Alpha/beta hydrolase fold-3 domain-containing protein n=1 Tax=Coffea canephora TaxID=49390 RepID=A0A068UWT5_COFCA|nr:unnamed protein product [Coffea canephora]
MADKITEFPPGNPQTDPYGFLGFVRNPDGSVARILDMPKTPVSSFDKSPVLLVKDIPVNPSKNTFVRIFLPRKAIESSPGTKLPLLIFIHGGGFVICSAATPYFESLYNSFTVDIPVVMVSIEYRLAPEHRLPAAYEDCMEVMQWIKSPQDEWLTKYADLSNSFLMGSSAGGNIAYHVGLSASSCVDDLKPLEIKGLILHQPFFGGTKRTESELRADNDKILPPCVTDVMWELSLPVGVDRNHEFYHGFCNPVLSIKPGQFDHIKDLGWKILVTGYDGDPLFDRQVELVKMLEDEGVPLAAKFAQGGYHGIDGFEPPKLKVLCQVVKEFMISFVTAA